MFNLLGFVSIVEDPHLFSTPEYLINLSQATSACRSFPFALLTALSSLSIISGATAQLELRVHLRHNICSAVCVIVQKGKGNTEL